MKPLEPDDPRDIAGYRILRVLGAGGMGRVYLGRSPGGRTVAVKVIRPELADDAGFRHLFRREVAAARRVGGTWTAPVLDADTESARPWLVTGYVAGPSVYTAVERFGPLPESSVRTLGAGLAEALTAIHGTGLVHRDLKPTNVLLSLDGPRVIDFGISRALDASAHTRTGATIGSPGFMSPEQVDGRDIGPATDVFSLGSVLVFAATGEGPFGTGNGQALMFRIVAKAPELGAVPPGLRNLVSACLAKYAGNRPTPQEILDQLAPNGGTATLVAPGWLPGPLTADLGRRAVELLEIDSHELDAHEAESAAQQAQSTDSAPPAAPASAPPGGTRGRRTPWLYISAAAAAVAIACTSVLIARADSGPGPATNPPTPSPSAGSPSTPPDTTAAAFTQQAASHGTTAAAVPADYVGTWSGTIASSGNTTSTTTFTVTIRATPDANGYVARTESHTSGLVPADCPGNARLSPADGPGLVLQDVPGATPGPTTLLGLPLCTSGGRTHVTLNPDGTLTCTVNAPGSGNPTGTLHRTKT